MLSVARKDGLSGDGLKVAGWVKRGERRSIQGDARREWAQRELAKIEVNRQAKREAADEAEKAEKRRRRSKANSKSKHQSKSVLAQALERSEVNRLVPKEAQAQGDYRFVPVTLIEVTEGGKAVKKESRAVRNMGGSPIERWAARGKLDERQIQAVLFYQEAYRKVFGEGPRMVASYSPVIVSGVRGAVELWARSVIAAREALRLLDQEVFFRLPLGHFPVWQNVVIWDEPAGVAGSRIGFCHKPAEAVALLMIQTMASMIADIVIDSSRRDFGDLILDLNAPRRPGGAP